MNNLFNVPTVQTPMLILFLSTGVLFDGAFSLRVSLMTIISLSWMGWNGMGAG